MSLIEIVRNSEQTKAKWRNDFNSIEWKNASKLNEILFGLSLNKKPKCSCLEDLFFMLKSKNINAKFKEKMEKQFILKKGKVISSFAFGFQLTEHSTDAQMMEALRLVPQLIVHFDKYPENWLKALKKVEEVAPVEEVEKIDYRAMTIKQLRALNPEEFTGKTRNYIISFLDKNG